jgi:hypothetical protein
MSISIFSTPSEATPANIEPLPGQPASVANGAVNEDPEKLIRKFLNPVLKGPNWDILIAAMSSGDAYNRDLARKVLNQLFISTATGKYLDQRGVDYGVRRPEDIGMDDELYRKYILTSVHEKLTLNSILKNLEIFYTTDNTRAAISSGEGPYVIEDEDNLLVVLDKTNTVEVVFLETDFIDPAVASAFEIANSINAAFSKARVTAFALAFTNAETGLDYVKIYSGALGLQGSVQILGGKAQNVLLFPTPITLTYAGTTITISQGSDATVARYKFTGTNPGFYKIKEGDYVSCFGPGFTGGNVGSFVVLESGIDSGSLYFDVDNSNWEAATVVLTSLSDFTAFTPERYTVYNANAPAIAAVPSPENSLRIDIPATSELVSRTETTAGYLDEGNTELDLSQVGFFASRDGYAGTADFDNEITVGGMTHNLSTDGGFAHVDGIRILEVDSSGFGAGFETSSEMTDFAFHSHSAVTLDDYRVLVAGGNDDVTERIESYLLDLETGYVNGPDMNQERTLFSMVKLLDGRVLAIGGYYAGNAIADCEIYDPDTDTWTITGSLNNARWGHKALLLPSGEVIAFGGNAAGEALERYDPTTGEWEELVSTLTARRYHSFDFLDQNRILVAGGQTIGGSQITSDDLINILFLDEPTVPFTTITSGLNVNKHATSFVDVLGSSGRLYAFGGSTANTKYFDPFTLTWTAGPTMQVARTSFTATKMDSSRVLLVGGSATTPFAEVFDPFTNEITTPINDYSDAILSLTDPFSKHTATLSYSEQGYGYKVPYVVIINGTDNLGTFGVIINTLYQEHIELSSGRVNGYLKYSYVDSTTFALHTDSVRPDQSDSFDLTEATVTPILAEISETGMFLLDPQNGLAITANETFITQNLNKNQSYSSIDIDDSTVFPDEPGYVVFNFGNDKQFGPVRYINSIGDKLLLEKQFIIPFSSNAADEITVTLLTQKELFNPTNAQELGAVYATNGTSPLNAAITTIENTVAAGITTDKRIRYPSDLGLGGAGSPTEQSQKLSDKVAVYGGNNVDDELNKARNS